MQNEMMPRVPTWVLRFEDIIILPHYSKPIWVLPGGRELAQIPSAVASVEYLWARPYDTALIGVDNV